MNGETLLKSVKASIIKVALMRQKEMLKLYGY